MWAAWSGLVDSGATPADIDLKCTQADLNRFCARYRVAKAFRGISMEGMTDGTVQGYAALFRLFLAWSAFEKYLDALECKQKNCAKLIERALTPSRIAEIRKLDEGNRFFNLISNKLTRKEHVEELEKYRKKSAFNPSYLASAVRHIFVHGHLTPNANGAAPEAVTQICDILSNAHLHVAGDDFARRVRKHQRALGKAN
jgi:hypothetical protein